MHDSSKPLDREGQILCLCFPATAYLIERILPQDQALILDRLQRALLLFADVVVERMASELLSKTLRQKTSPYWALQGGMSLRKNGLHLLVPQVGQPARQNRTIESCAGRTSLMKGETRSPNMDFFVTGGLATNQAVEGQSC
jgi:hypothetical protein